MMTKVGLCVRRICESQKDQRLEKRGNEGLLDHMFF
jgi:hypothetical protein